MADQVETWTESDEASHVGTCELCGAVTVVRSHCDPCVEEVYGEWTEPSELCYRCWSDRKDDV